MSTNENKYKRSPLLALQELLCYLEDEDDPDLKKLIREVVPLLKPLKSNKEL